MLPPRRPCRGGGRRRRARPGPGAVLRFPPRARAGAEGPPGGSATPRAGTRAGGNRGRAAGDRRPGTGAGRVVQRLPRRAGSLRSCGHCVCSCCWPGSRPEFGDKYHHSDGRAAAKLLVQEGSETWTAKGTEELEAELFFLRNHRWRQWKAQGGQKSTRCRQLNLTGGILK